MHAMFDRTHPSPQDQRHAVNLDLSCRPSRTWPINASYAFHTGWPATLERGVEIIGPGGEPDIAVKPDTLWGGRLPSYHRIGRARHQTSGEPPFLCRGSEPDESPQRLGIRLLPGARLGRGHPAATRCGDVVYRLTLHRGELEQDVLTGARMSQRRRSHAPS